MINPPESLGRFTLGTLEQLIRPGQNLTAEDLDIVRAGCAHALTAQEGAAWVLQAGRGGTGDGQPV